jgi:hypothetical protein
MTTPVRVNDEPLKLVLAVCLMGGAGMWGLIVLFSDFRYANWIYLVYVIATHFGPALVAGMLVPSRWYVAGFAAWGAVFLAALFGMAEVGAYLRGNPVPPITDPRRLGYLYFLLGIPSVALLGGFLGRTLVRVFGRRLPPGRRDTATPGHR